ncbi:ABC transporter permease [Gossypium arboreum]|uniref:ABC transporter permease n=1 Tax=Gossypium arboreum TaxID=29729 RepID=A0A0B0P9L0_GOSAR|nr:ABC transporter permease [Gossypium arboreum]
MLYNPPIEKAGLIANQDGPSGGKSDKDHLTCDYCGKPRHTKDSCWKLHGHPTQYRGGKQWKDKSTSAGSFTSDEIQHLVSIGLYLEC